MPIDRYTKAVLTVIAGALIYIAAMLGGSAAGAQGPPASTGGLIEPGMPQPVVVVGWGTLRDDGQVLLQRIRDTTGMMRTDVTLPVSLQATPERPLPVTIARQPIAVALNVTPLRPLPVGIAAIKPGGPDWEQIRVKVEPQPPASRPGFP
jgi:hypothetical protein